MNALIACLIRAINILSNRGRFTRVYFPTDEMAGQIALWERFSDATKTSTRGYVLLNVTSLNANPIMRGLWERGWRNARRSFRRFIKCCCRETWAYTRGCKLSSIRYVCRTESCFVTNDCQMIFTYYRYCLPRGTKCLRIRKYRCEIYSSEMYGTKEMNY